MSLLGKNILNDLVKPNGNKSLINSSNIVNNSGKYSNISFNSLKTKINKTPLEPEFAPANLMYFLQTAFSGNYGFLGFAFLQCYIDKDLNAQDIYDKYFKDPEEVKKIIKHYTKFYDEFLEQIKNGTYAGPDSSLIILKPFIQDLKTNYEKTYFQIIPFYLLQFINEQDFKFDTKIGEKMKELVINPDFKEKCIQLYQIYNQNNSQELTKGLFPYLKNNISFQVLISNMGFNKIGKGIGDDIWIYKTENSAGILTSNRINKDEPAIQKFFKTNLGITEEEKYQNITEEEYGLLKSYYNFLQTQINDASKDAIIEFLLKKQVERLNIIKNKFSIVSANQTMQSGGAIKNRDDYVKLFDTDRLEIVEEKINKKEETIKQILIKMILLTEKSNEKRIEELKTRKLKELIEYYVISKYNSFYNQIGQYVDSLPTQTQPDWVKCKDNCKTLAKEYIDFETKTTLYYLTFLAKSFIEDDQTKKLKLVFTGDSSRLTGFWKDDMKLFKLDSEQFNPKKGRLIMGFGPSASGKTYWAKNIIKILNKTDENFPPNFLSIDGGIMREVSLTYQMLKNLAKTKVKVKGFENLGGKGISSPLFNTDDIKGQVLEFLKQSKQPKPNLYVPHTLTECTKSTSLVIPSIFTKKQSPSCKEIAYQQYIDITKDDRWTGLMIYQHRTNSSCPFEAKYKCKGCKESGKDREVEEGKKYSSSSWQTAYNYGMEQYQKAGGYKILIHNSGDPNRSSLIYSPNLIIGGDYNLIKCTNKECVTFVENESKFFIEKEEKNQNSGIFKLIGKSGEVRLPYNFNKKEKVYTIAGKYSYNIQNKQLKFVNQTSNRFKNNYLDLSFENDILKLSSENLDVNDLFIICFLVSL